MTMVSVSSTFVSRLRVSGAVRYLSRRRSSHTPSASSAWKVPECVPTVMPIDDPFSDAGLMIAPDFNAASYSAFVV